MLRHVDSSQALYLEESTLRFVSSDWLDMSDLTEKGCSQADE